MQNIYAPTKGEKIQIGYILTAGLAFLSIFSVFLLGMKGLYLAIAGILGLIVVPLIYKQSNFFLLFSLLVFPFSRIFSPDDKFLITGGLYLLSFPCAIALIQRYLGKCSKNYVYLWGMGLYLGVILLNFFRPELEFMELAKDFGRTFYAIFIILAIHNYISDQPEKLNKLNQYISYLMNIMAALSIGQLLTGIGGINIEGYYRLRGTFTNSNDYGFILAIFIPFAFCMFLNSIKNREKTYWGITIALNLAVLLFTFSKTSIINTIMALAIMAFFLPSRTKAKLFATIAVLAPFMVAILGGTGLMTNLMTRFADTRSLIWREEMWRNLYSEFLQGNIYLGQGPNASRDFFQYIMPMNSTIAPHNVYLEQLYNLGIVGIIPFILIFLLVLFKGFFIFREKMAEGLQNKIIGTTLISIALITLVQNYFSNAFYDRAGNIIYWAIITLLVCGYNYYKRENCHSETIPENLSS